MKKSCWLTDFLIQEDKNLPDFRLLSTGRLKDGATFWIEIITKNFYFEFTTFHEKENRLTWNQPPPKEIEEFFDRLLKMKGFQ